VTKTLSPKSGLNPQEASTLMPDFTVTVNHALAPLTCRV
jgi:hypothetical protein